jgi:hypothetical protein
MVNGNGRPPDNFEEQKHIRVRLRISDEPGTYRQLNETSEIEGPQGSIQLITLTVCKGDGRVLHDATEVAAACTIGYEPLCKECAEKFRCALCGKIICPDHRTDFRGTFVCRGKHGFFQLLFFKA